MSLVDFFADVANKKEYADNGEGFVRDVGYVPNFSLSEVDTDYIFSVLDLGIQLSSHWAKYPAKDKLCVKKYYGEECDDCKAPTGRKNVRKVKEKDKDGNEVEVEKEFDQLNKPVRNLHSFIYLHNHTGGQKPSRNNPDNMYPTDTVLLAKFQCGELNTNSNLEKDRNVKQILEVANMGCLDGAVFKMSRTKVKDPKTGKEKDQNIWPVPLPEKAKIKYKIPGVGMTENLVSKLVIPTDIKEKWDNMTIGEKVGIILDHFDPETVYGSPAKFDADGREIKPDTTHRKGFWLDKDIVFPVKAPRAAAKESEEKSMDDE